MRYWLLITTFVNTGNPNDKAVVSTSKSKLRAKDLAHAMAMKKELHSKPMYDGTIRRTEYRTEYLPVWQECDVCAEIHTGRMGGTLFIPVDHLQSLANEVGDAAIEYRNDPHHPRMGSKLKPSVFVRPAAEPARLSDTLPTPSTKYNDDEE